MTPLKTLSSNPWAFSPLIALIGPYSAKAHEGHGDTVVHAVIHLSEDGLFIGLAIVLVCARYYLTCHEYPQTTSSSQIRALSINMPPRRTS
jgi:hypothetical protein